VSADAHVRRAALSDLQLVALLFALALGLRAVTALRTAVIFADGPSFVELAERIAAGLSGGDWEGVLRHPYHPLYSALMVLARPLFGDLETAGVVCSILGGSVAVVALHAFLRDAFDSQVAWIGALLLALAPYAVRFSADVQSDGLYLALFLLAVTWLWRALERASPLAAALAGGFAGLAYLARPEGVGVVLVGGLLAAAKLYTRRWQLGQLMPWLGALVGGFAALALPYLWALSTVNGSWMLSGKKSLGGLLGVIDAPTTVASSSGALVGGLALLLLFAVALRRPSVGLRAAASSRLALALGGLAATGVVVLSRVVPFGREYTGVVLSSLGPAVIVWAGVGLLVRRDERRPNRALFIGAFLGLYGLVLAALLLNYGYLSRRHALPPLALLLGYTAIGVCALADALRRGARRLGSGRRLTVGASLALALLIVGSSELPKTLRRHRDDALAQRRAAEWLRGQAMPPGPLAAAKRRTAYYADRVWVQLRYGGDGRDAASLQVGPARYAIVDHEIAASPEGLRYVELHRVEALGQLAVVYQIVRNGRP
jgi:4-amino-4-deoxy-L-arabinose transferase-like glycosyltransferase